jgi:hypothetical protein
MYARYLTLFIILCQVPLKGFAEPASPLFELSLRKNSTDNNLSKEGAEFSFISDHGNSSMVANAALGITMLKTGLLDEYSTFSAFTEIHRDDSTKNETDSWGAGLKYDSMYRLPLTRTDETSDSGDAEELSDDNRNSVFLFPKLSVSYQNDRVKNTEALQIPLYFDFLNASWLINKSLSNVEVEACKLPFNFYTSPRIGLVYQKALNTSDHFEGDVLSSYASFSITVFPLSVQMRKKLALTAGISNWLDVEKASGWEKRYPADSHTMMRLSVSYTIVDGKDQQAQAFGLLSIASPTVMIVASYTKGSDPVNASYDQQKFKIVVSTTL